MEIIDARGLSCPEPVIMVNKAMAAAETEYIVIVDNHAAKENVIRYAENKNYSVTCNEKNGEYTLEIKKCI